MMYLLVVWASPASTSMQKAGDHVMLRQYKNKTDIRTILLAQKVFL